MSGIMKERRYAPAVLIDIALPRDIEADVKKIYNCYLYDMDSLKTIVGRNFTQREQGIAKADEIIDYEVDVFAKWLNSLNAQGTIKEMYSLMEACISEQIEEKASILGNRERIILEEALRSMGKRLMNRPVSFIKGHPKLDYIENMRRIFWLDEDYKDRHKRQQIGPGSNRNRNTKNKKYRNRS